MITLKKNFSDITNFVFNKKVIVRVDLNLPYFDGKVSDFTRVEKIIPTIDFLFKKQSKNNTYFSFWADQKVKNKKEFSLDLIISDIKTVLKKKFTFVMII